MSTITQILGWLVIALVALGIAGFGLGYLYERIEDWRQRRLRRAVELELRYRGMLMRDQHHWFGANVELAAMWQACSDTLLNGNCPDASRVRSELPARAAALRKEWS